MDSETAGEGLRSSHVVSCSSLHVSHASSTRTWLMELGLPSLSSLSLVWVLCHFSSLLHLPHIWFCSCM